MIYESFVLHFRSKKQVLCIGFHREMHPSDKSVIVDGHFYRLQGEAFKIDWIKAKIPELSRYGLSIVDLQVRVLRLGVSDFTMYIFGMVFGKPQTWVRDISAEDFRLSDRSLKVRI